MGVLGLVPARAGSKGIPGKNLRELGGKSLIEHAVRCAIASGCTTTVVSSDLSFLPTPDPGWWAQAQGQGQVQWLARPAELAGDAVAMLDVVTHALGEIPGEPDDIIVLLQPTQPFRTPEHVRQAVQLLRETQADSVVSVVRLPQTHHADLQYGIGPDGALWGYTMPHERPTRRQDVSPTYRFDGTVYAFWRRTVTAHGSIYGRRVRPLIIPAEQSCELDTLDDWAAAERRWKEQHG